MLINRAKTLTNLPYSSLQQLQSSIQRARQLFAQAQRIAYDVQQMNHAYTNRYIHRATSRLIQSSTSSPTRNRISKVIHIQTPSSRPALSTTSTPTVPRRRRCVTSSRRESSSAGDAGRQPDSSLSFSSSATSRRPSPPGQGAEPEAAQRAAAQDQGRGGSAVSDAGPRLSILNVHVSLISGSSRSNSCHLSRPAASVMLVMAPARSTCAAMSDEAAYHIGWPGIRPQRHVLE